MQLARVTKPATHLPVQHCQYSKHSNKHCPTDLLKSVSAWVFMQHRYCPYLFLEDLSCAFLTLRGSAQVFKDFSIASTESSATSLVLLAC